MQYRYFLAMCLLIIMALPCLVLAEERLFQHRYTETIYAPIPPEFHKLTQRLARWNHDAEAELTKLEESTHPKVVSWLKAVKALDHHEGLALITAINSLTNEAVAYVDDYQHYHKDYWAPPYETLVEGGDCEDIALLKAVALHIHGWDVKERAHILIGMIDFKGKPTAHAVLEVDRGDGVHHVMRSINNSVPTFDEMDKIMQPIYMMSSKNLVVFKEDGAHHAYNIFNADDLNFSTAAGAEKLGDQ